MSASKNEFSAVRYGFTQLAAYLKNTDKKWTSWLLLLTMLLSVLAIVGLFVAFSWWSTGFWAALTAKTLIPFLWSMGEFAIILGGMVSAFSLKNFVTNRLANLWRHWLSNNLSTKLLDEHKNFLHIECSASNLDNLHQRIQEDVKKFVSHFLHLTSDFIRSALSLGIFIGTLWVVGGAFTFTALGLTIVIPGYLVWVALISAMTASFLTHIIGKPLSSLRKQEERAEAEFRNSITPLQEDAENIAEERAEEYYRATISHRIKEVSEITKKSIAVQTRVVAFQNGYLHASSIIPYLLAAPLYFTGLIELAQLMQVATAFSQVNSSLSWFVESYPTLINYRTRALRIHELSQQCDMDHTHSLRNNIRVEERPKDTIKVKGLTLLRPYPRADKDEPILTALNLTLNPGEHTIIKAPSGLGKSTLFKAIAGTWFYGEGRIKIPSDKTRYIVPQYPTMPSGTTLKELLTYPEEAATYSDDDCLDALEKVGLNENNKFSTNLEERRNWRKLSGGERQRISFARAWLKKPNWLFLDEATSALDEENETLLYKLVTSRPQEMTVVSIAHRSTVNFFHQRIFELAPNKKQEPVISPSL